MIYFIQYGNDGPVKIGTVGGHNACAVSHRLMGLQGATPTKLRILGFCKGGKKEEILLHKKMQRFRVSGEWFALQSELIEVIKKLSILSEADRILYEETISSDELTKRLQDELNLDCYYKVLSKFISNERNIPRYKVFGKNRYKYEEAKRYLTDKYPLEKIRVPIGTSSVCFPDI